MNRSKNFIKTSQFAKFCNVSKQTLIYYDKIGIFKPSYVDEKGYRYYSFAQQEAFYVITMLRHLGTPLKEIKEYIENRSINSFLNLLDKKQDEINNRIIELNKLSNLIDKRRSMTRYGMKNINTEDVVIYTLPEEHIILSKPIFKHNDMSYSNIISELQHYTAKHNYQTFMSGAMVSKESLIEKDYNNLSHFFIKTDTVCNRTYTKPAGLYAVTYHHNDYDTTYLAYDRLLRYIEDNGYEIVGNSYENILLDFCTQKNESEYLSEISIQVELSINI
jgi:effector-binding domain-containing protein